MRELLAALSLRKAEFAEIFRISRRTLDDWLAGNEPGAADARRLATVSALLTHAGVSASAPIPPRFLRQVLVEGAPSLLESLSAEALDEPLVASLLQEAEALRQASIARRVERERVLRERGFEEPSDEQRREQLARNVALRDWPQP